MCGIAGFVSFLDNKSKDTQSINQAELILDNMLNAILHRGPDSKGKYIAPPFIAGMQRLAINGIKDGNQPLYSTDENIVLFYNGEIYNYPTLKQKLITKNYTFKTHSDGEVICHMYQEYGIECFKYLDGMFAIALWDNKKQELILARDYFGEKPLYYSTTDTGIIFGSEIKAITKHPKVNLDLNHQAIWDFPSFLWVPEPSTIYKNIFALPKANILKINNKNKEFIKFTPLSFTKSLNIPIQSKNLFQTVQDTVIASINSQLLSEAEIGCFLSGGLDSSIITSVVSKSINKFNTFSVAFEDISCPIHGFANEAKQAQWFAKKLGTQHHEIFLNGTNVLQMLDKFCHHADQPFGVSSGLGILAISEQAKNLGIKVLLSGDGADEAFGGYSWYFNLKNSNDGHNQAFDYHYYASSQEKLALFNQDFSAQKKISNRYFENFKPTPNWEKMDFIRQDRDFYFPNEMLTKLDRMTMANSVEGRIPFAAPMVYGLAEQFNISDLIKNNTLKYTLRQAFQELLPEDIIKRPKHGFNVPIDYWLQTSWQQLLKHSFSRESKLYKLGFINNNSYKQAINLLNKPRVTNGHTLFCFIMLNKWLENEY